MKTKSNILQNISNLDITTTYPNIKTESYNEGVQKCTEWLFKTQGVKYMGSKKTLIPNIYDKIKDLNINTVLDGFAGTTRVSQFFKKCGFNVISNDLNIWSKTFGECYLLNKKSKEYYQEKIDHLNSLKGKVGYYTKQYGGDGTKKSSVGKDGNKKMWQKHNTMKLDAIRDEIDLIAADEIEKSVLITSLMLALDKVDNALGHQCSYLREWSPRSYKNLFLEVPELITDESNNQNCKSINGDVFDTISKNKVDLAYFDPPYGTSNCFVKTSGVRYSIFYHIWKSIILNDKPSTQGKANRRADMTTENTYTPFEDFRTDKDGELIAKKSIFKLIKDANAKHVLLSYNTNSKVQLEDIEMFSKKNKWKCDIDLIDYKKNAMAYMCSSEKYTNLKDKENYEILVLISK